MIAPAFLVRDISRQPCRALFIANRQSIRRLLRRGRSARQTYNELHTRLGDMPFLRFCAFLRVFEEREC